MTNIAASKIPYPLLKCLVRRDSSSIGSSMSFGTAMMLINSGTVGYSRRPCENRNLWTEFYKLKMTEGGVMALTETGLRDRIASW